MKRIMIVLSLIAFAMLPCSALAGCEKHPNATETFKIRTNYVQEDDYWHRKELYSLYICDKCGASVAGSDLEITYEKHTFNSNHTCTKCNYHDRSFSESDDTQDWNGNNKSDKEKTRERLSVQNMQWGTNAIGMDARVCYAGTVRSEPNGGGVKLGQTIVNNLYRITDYQRFSDNSVYFRILFNGQEGWILANNVEVVSGSSSWNDYGFCELHTGKTVQMKSQWRTTFVRTGPGESYSYFTTVTPRQSFYVNECYINEEGQHWLKIEVNNREGWVIAGRFNVLD